MAYDQVQGDQIRSGVVHSGSNVFETQGRGEMSKFPRKWSSHPTGHSMDFRHPLALAYTTRSKIPIFEDLVCLTPVRSRWSAEVHQKRNANF